MTVPHLNCKRCDQPLCFIGERRFHEGTNWGALGDLGELFVKKDAFNLFVCPVCGGIEWFLPRQKEKDLPAPPDPNQLTWTCYCEEVNVMSQEYCRECARPRK